MILLTINSFLLVMFKGYCDPEYKRIHDKYGNSLDGIPMEYIEMFEEIDTILDKFDELICDYLEDLKAYALMYRNVHIKSNRVIDRIYFAKKAEEIKGFKNKVYSQNGNTRTQVLRYYLEYGALFELYCLKQVGIKLEQIYTGSRDIRGSRNNNKITDLITIEEYNNVKRGQLGREFGVVSLSNEQCTTLLKNIGELETISTNNKYQIDSFPLYDNEIDFVKNIVIPYYYDERRFNLNRQCLKRFAEEKGRKMNVLSDSLFEEGKTIYQLNEQKNMISLVYKDAIINELLKEREELLRPSLELNNNKQQPFNTITKDNKPKIDDIEKRIKNLRAQYRDGIISKYNAFINKLSSSLGMFKTWYYMFNHQDELCVFFSSFYMNEYLRFLHTKPNNNLIHSIDVFIEAKNRNRDILDFSDIIKKIYKKEGIQSQHLLIARLWTAHIKELEEQKRKAREEQERKRLEQFRFNIRNKHGNDSKISFRESDHIYMVDGVPLDSVTSFVTNCFPKFNTNFYAKRKAEELGKRPEEVLAEWEKKGQESRELGTAMHRKIEDYYLGKNPASDETFDLFRIFANKITLKPYRTEWAVYDWEQKIAGTIDFVDYQNGEYTIYDWKRSDKLIAKNGLPIKNSQYGEKALPPIENLDNSPYYHYALQLSLYKYILEKNYGITVSKLRLGIFHPSYNKPYVLEMPYMQNEIDTLFGLRSEVVF